MNVKMPCLRFDVSRLLGSSARRFVCLVTHMELQLPAICHLNENYEHQHCGSTHG